MQFMNGYFGHSLCSPSRTAFFTELHTGMFYKHNISGYVLNQGEILTITEVLKAAGYETALFGKSDPLNDPFGSGFDEFLGTVTDWIVEICTPES